MVVKRHCKEKVCEEYVPFVQQKDACKVYTIFLEIYRRTVVASGEGEWSLDLDRDLPLYCISFCAVLHFL